MAESNSTIYDSLITCSICKDIYVQPKCLPNCLHSFCCKCLLSCALSNAIKTEYSLSFDCPLCRKNYVSYLYQTDANAWVKSLPLNHFIISLIEREHKKCCFLCLRRNACVDATTWCKECSDYLCALCEIEHRNLKEKHEVCDMNADNARQSKSFIFCDIHPKREVEFYCHSEAQVMCALCAAVHHKNCNTSVLEECVKNISHEADVSSQNLLSIKEEIDKMQEILDTEKYVSIFEEERSRIKAKTLELRTQLQKKKEEVLSQLKRIETKDETSFIETMNRFSEKIRKMDSHVHVLETFTSTNLSDVKAYRGYLKARSDKRATESSILDNYYTFSKDTRDAEETVSKFEKLTLKLKDRSELVVNPCPPL